jgi:hypothetical protein
MTQGWPPDVMRRQRVGDLHAILDAMVERLHRLELERRTRR